MPRKNTAAWIPNEVRPASRTFPKPPRLGHDPLCLAVTSAYDPPMESCWCRCSKCWDNANKRCICRLCPCPMSDQGMGPTMFAPQSTLAPQIRPSERTQGRHPLGRSAPGMPTTSKVEAGRTPRGPRPGAKKANKRKAS